MIETVLSICPNRFDVIRLINCSECAELSLYMIFIMFLRTCPKRRLDKVVNIPLGFDAFTGAGIQI